MKILISCPAIGLSGGSGIRARLLAEGLIEAGADVVVLSSKIPSDWSSEVIKIVSLKKEQSWRATLSEVARDYSPDVIYGITEAAADAVLAVAKKNHCCSALDLHGLGFVEVLELGSGYGRRLPRIYNSLRWLSKMPSVDLVTVANPRLFPVVKWLNRRTYPLFGGTNVSMFAPQGKRQKLGWDCDAIQVLYAGNFHKWQGVDLLFEAIKSLGEEIKSFEFTFMGAVGKHEDKVKELIADLPAGRVHIRDAVDYSNVSEYYRGADLLIIPRPFMLSTYLAFPQKMSDYMASGRVVLATDLAPHRWALTQPEAGVLCTASSTGLVEGLLACKNSALREELGRIARQRAVDQFCHLAQGRKLFRLFEELLSEKKDVR